MEQYGKFATIRNAQQQNQLADMMMAKEQRSVDSENALSQAYSGAMGADGTMDRNKLYQSLAQGGQGRQLPAIQKGFADQDKSTLEASKASIEMAMKKQQVIAQHAGAAVDQSSWDRAIAAVGQMGIDVSQIPRQFDSAMAKTLLTQSLSGSDQLAQHWKQVEAKMNADKFGYQQKHDTEVLGVQVAGQARQEQASLRADSRARDFNATKVEENTLKREAKNDIANLTKSGQIASFDTMLGTLGRLGTHSGLPASVGMMGKFPSMPGSESSNFKAELETFQSQAFIPMVSQLKGMGALSDAEGKKLTAAVGALNPNMGEKAFRESLSRITEDMTAARERVAGGGRAAPAPAAPVNLNSMTPAQKKTVSAQAEQQFNIRPQKMPVAGDVEGGFRFKGGNASNPANWVRQ